MSLILSALLLGLDGAVYVELGLRMLLPRMGPFDLLPVDWGDWVAGLYPSLFREAHLSTSSSSPGSCGDGADHVEEEEGRAGPQARHPLCVRLLGYLLVVVGVCRLVTCFHWGCGYMYLGLATCLAEMGMLCNELLRFESLHLHRCIAVLMLNVAVSLTYIGAGLPYCR